MGIGGGIFLITVGAILAFAVRAQVPWIDIHVVGWVLMLAGLAVLELTIWFWRDRRRPKTAPPVLVHEAVRAHRRPMDMPPPPDPPDLSFTQPPPPPQ
ncbi:MAG TPA: DUF6458 family protein [Micromonosporaceae bacterium]